MPTLRLFVAIETPPGVRSRIAATRDDLKGSGANVRWESDQKLHATIKFLGSTEEDLLPEIVSYIGGVARRHPPPRVRYAGLGCFPTPGDPRVIWVGIEDLDGELAATHREIEEELARLGFEKEDRAFRPHVTLGRVKGRERIQSLLARMESITFETEPVSIQEIAVVKSDLKPGGSVYTTLKSIPFTATATAR
jgi:2'-5' RNA ligase